MSEPRAGHPEPVASPATPPAPPTRRRRKTFLLGGGTLLLLLPILCTAWILDDDELLPADDLRPVPLATVSDEENALFYLEQAHAALRESEELTLGHCMLLLDAKQYRELEEAELAEVATFLRNNRELFEHFERASRCSVYVGPVLEEHDQPVPHANAIRSATQVQVMEGDHALITGDLETARTVAERLLACGERIILGSQSLLDFLVGLAVQSCGLDLQRRVLLDPGVTLEFLEENRWGSCDPLAQRAALERALRWEFTRLENVLEEALERQDVSFLETLLYKENRTRNQSAARFRELIDRVHGAWEPGEADSSAPSKLEKVTLTLSGNLLGETILELTMAAFEKAALERQRVHEVMAAVTRLLLAIRKHELRHGRLTDSLAELVPTDLDEIPRDPFDGQPLRYDPEGRIVYSVGTDQVDAGGSNEKHGLKDHEEPTLRLDGTGG